MAAFPYMNSRDLAMVLSAFALAQRRPRHPAFWPGCEAALLRASAAPAGTGAGWPASSLRALAALRKGPRRAVIDALLRGVLRESPSPRDLAQALWALGRMRYVADAHLAAALDSALEGCVRGLSNEALCQVTWSWRRTGTASEPAPGVGGGANPADGDACPLAPPRRRALDAVHAEAERRMADSGVEPAGGFRGWQVVMLVDELQRLGQDPGPALFRALDEVLAPGGASLGALDARPAVLALRVLVRSRGAVRPEVLEGLLVRIEAGMSRLSASSLATLLKALGELEHSPGPGFMGALRRQARRRLAAFNESRLLDALAGFAALKVHPGQELLQRFTDSMRSG